MSELLVEQEKFLSEGVHIGTKQKSKQMEEFIYEIRPNGLAVLNLQKLSDRMKIAAKFLSRFKPEKVLIVATREKVARFAEKASEIINASSFTGRFPPGSLTNPRYEEFMEPEVVLVTNPIADRQAINEASKIGVPVAAFCDTNNSISNIDLVIPCNNKGERAMGFMFWLLGKVILKNREEIKDDEYVSFEEFLKDGEKS